MKRFTELFTSLFTAITGAESSATYLKLVTTLKYQYPYRAIKPFLEAGMVNALGLPAETKFIALNSITIPPHEVSGNLFPPRQYEQSWCVGMGATYHKLGAEIMYDSGNGMGNGDIHMVTYTWNLMLKYQLLYVNKMKN